MAYLLDTNILLRFISPNDPKHLKVVAAVETLNKQRERLVISPQNLIELWNVCTRPLDKNGLGFDIDRTQKEVERLKGLFIFLPDVGRVYSEWERLVNSYQVRGVNVHDTRLVAFMLVHKISYILTFNIKDFRRFSSEIMAVSPDEIVDIGESYNL